MHYKVKEQLLKHNIPFERHYAKQITVNDYNNFDIIVYFDDYNFNNLKKMLPDTSKLVKLSSVDVDDPWYTNDFDKAYNEIYDGCVFLLKKVENE